MSEELKLEEDDVVSESAEYSPKSEFSKAKLVYEATSRCVDSRGKEMIAGFWNVKLTKDGTPIKTWEADSRKVFVGSVIALKNLLFPERKGNERMIIFEGKFKNAEKKLYEKYCYTERTREVVNGSIVWKPTGKKFMPSTGAKVVILRNDHQYVGRNFADEVLGGWDSYVDAYYEELLLLYDKLFEKLNELIHEKNYFKPEASF